MAGNLQVHPDAEGIMRRLAEAQIAEREARDVAKTPEQHLQEVREKIEEAFDHKFRVHLRKYRTVRESEKLKQRLTAEQGFCPHEKPNRVTAVTGTHTANGVVYFCQFCLKTWNETELPPSLRPPADVIGGRVTGVGTAEVSKLYVEQQNELQQLALDRESALVSFMETTMTLDWKSTSKKLVKDPGEIIWNK